MTTTRAYGRYNRTICIEYPIAHHPMMKRTVVWLTDKQTKALAKMSAKSLASISALVRQAVEEFLVEKMEMTCCRKPLRKISGS